MLCLKSPLKQSLMVLITHANNKVAKPINPPFIRSNGSDMIGPVCQKLGSRGYISNSMIAYHANSYPAETTESG